METTVVSSRGFELRLLWVALGILVEFLLVPTEIHGTNGMLQHGSLFENSDFYYAVVSPVVIWWFFHFLVPSKKGRLGQTRAPLLNFILGFYASSVVRAALAAFFAIHLGVWTAATR